MNDRHSSGRWINVADKLLDNWLSGSCAKAINTGRLERRVREKTGLNKSQCRSSAQIVSKNRPGHPHVKKYATIQRAILHQSRQHIKCYVFLQVGFREINVQEIHYTLNYCLFVFYLITASSFWGVLSETEQKQRRQQVFLKDGGGMCFLFNQQRQFQWNGIITSRTVSLYTEELTH